MSNSKRNFTKPGMRASLHHAAAALLFLLLGQVIQAQQASKVYIHFSFPSSLAPRFTDVPQTTVEKEISAALAKTCARSETLHYWSYDSAGTGIPRLEVSVFARNGSYWLRVEVKHASSPVVLTDSWEGQLFSPEYLSAHSLPMNSNWIEPVQDAFQSMIVSTSKPGRELLAGLKMFAPLGTAVVLIPPSVSNGQPAAVLPLAWDRYQDIASCHFRILFREPTMLITLHASGTGGPLDFTPDAPQYKALWVIHESWQQGGLHAEDMSKHVDDLAGLGGFPSEFYLDTGDCSPAGVSVANN